MGRKKQKQPRITRICTENLIREVGADIALLPSPWLGSRAISANLTNLVP